MYLSIRKFDRNAIRIPNTILNWNIPESFPRLSAGAISEINIGAATVDAPTPNPPMKRANMKNITFGAIPDKTAEIKYSNPTDTSVFFRPNLAVGIPPNIAPTTVPHNAILIARPWTNPFPNCHRFWKVSSAPDMTMVSKPNKKYAIKSIL
jgi:hypothetical protein